MRPPQLPQPISSVDDCKFNFLTDKNIDEDKQWKLMMDYFKKNPQALMDAIPTPPGEEEYDALADFHTGLTPKKNFQFKFGQMDPSGTFKSNRPNATGSFMAGRRPMSSTSSQTPKK